VQIPLVDLKKQYQGIKIEVLAGIEQALDGMQLNLGKNTQAFESDFARYCGTDFAIAVGSGTEALQLALMSSGIGRGDEIITVSNTFVAAAEAITLLGAKPVFVDIDPETYNMDVNQIEEKINTHTRAILPVHLYGNPANMDPILEIAKVHQLKVIEDACQAHGAVYKGHRTGSMGNAGCFSFYFTKNLGAYGEAGIIVTSDPDLAKKCRMLRDHGSNIKNHHQLIGINGRVDEIQAAVLRVKLPHLDEWNEKRRRLAQAYHAGLPSTYFKPKEMTWAKHVYYLYVIRSPGREHLKSYLETKGIASAMHYSIPVHLQEAYRSLGGKNLRLPVTERIMGEILSLPMYPELSIEEVGYICDCIREFTDSYSKVAIKV
jgi:dTDP-4-amino-4,6-dideoxygalactose transaminase